MTEDKNKEKEKEKPESKPSETEDKEKETTDAGRSNDIGKMERALKAANKEAEKFRKELQELKDKDKSDSERLTDKASAAEARANQAELTLMRYEVGSAKGLTMGQAKRLIGNTREELEADADDMREDLGITDDDKGKNNGDGKETGGTGGRPKEKLRPGASNNNNDDTTSPDEIADQVIKSARGF